MNDHDQAILDASLADDDVEEQHDADCPMASDGGGCTCEPEAAPDRTACWTGRNFDEVAALLRPATTHSPSLTSYADELTISDPIFGRARVNVGDTVTRDALGVLRVVRAVPDAG